MYIFDLEQTSDYDEQTSYRVETRLLVPWDQPTSETMEELEYESAQVLNVVLRELIKIQLLHLREENYEGPANLYLVLNPVGDGADFAVLVATWTAWEDLLHLLMGAVAVTEVPITQCADFRNVRPLLDQLRNQALRFSSDFIQGQLITLAEGLEMLCDTALARGTTATSNDFIDDIGQQAQDNIDRLISIAQISGDSLSQSFIATGEALKECFWPGKTLVWEYTDADWTDRMTWGGLSASQQVAVVTRLNEEGLDPSSILGALLMTLHPGTHPEARALINQGPFPEAFATRLV